MKDIEEIARLVEGKLFGAKDIQVSGICSLDEPLENCISYYHGQSEQALLKLLKQKHPPALILSSKINPSEEILSKVSVISVVAPYLAFQKLIPIFHPEVKRNPSISEKAEIHSSAKIGENVSIGAFSVIGANVTIEDNVTIYSHVVIYENSIIRSGSILHAGCIIRERCIIENNCIIYNGAVIGSDGFGYQPSSTGELTRIPQIGITKLEKNVEVGANTCIDRATLGTTKIGQGSKLDNLVQVGHNVTVGHNSVICGLTGIAGSSKIGNRVVLGGQTGVADHVKITDLVRVGAGATVERDITSAGDYAGKPLMEIGKWRRYTAKANELWDMIKGDKKS